MRRSGRSLISALVLLSASLGAVPAAAQDQSNIDLSQGPLLASTRVLGLGGAFVAVAEGTEGNRHNPATPAVRPVWSVDHFDYDIGADFTLPAFVPGSDYFNSGSSGGEETRGFVFLSLSLTLYAGSWGMGLAADGERYGIRPSGDAQPGIEPEEMTANFAVVHSSLAKSFDEGQYVFGLGPRVTGMRVARGGGDLFGAVGVGVQGGFLYRPNWKRVRVGVAARSTVAPGTRQSAATAGDPRPIPERVTLPWELVFGAAVQLGPRPMNPRWTDPRDLTLGVEQRIADHEREREQQLTRERVRAKAQGQDPDAAEDALEEQHERERDQDDEWLEEEQERVRRILKRRVHERERFYVLISSEFAYIGSANDAAGVRALADADDERSGNEVSFSPRVGIESEVLPHWLKLRVGSYAEPARAEGKRWRPHGTFGFDLALFDWSLFGLLDDDTRWQISAAGDVSRSYGASSFSFSSWH